jgi:hypothetical protein
MDLPATAGYPTLYAVAAALSRGCAIWPAAKKFNVSSQPADKGENSRQELTMAWGSSYLRPLRKSPTLSF